MGKDQELLQAVKTEDVAAMQKLLQRPKQGKAMDLLELHTAQRVFDQHKLTQTEQLLNVTEVINCLTSIYDVLEQNHKDLVNVPLCVDMCLNWLLNVFDIIETKPDSLSCLSAVINQRSGCVAVQHRDMLISHLQYVPAAEAQKALHCLQPHGHASGSEGNGLQSSEAVSGSRSRGMSGRIRVLSLKIRLT
ncbi:uncharacterized protein LOC132209065 isoform X2 [Stegostoma tigrinum]|uniref:uncharacterized protein LOC132209065 isoform X2 n=1 Tax=Stegostoma tigrinum TaxID=3053191 RepID=UPI0028709FF1|nr:uncharacterized protein LOC132209065 isoform X2 [Stegostoma tigrinum]